jgi:peptide/nickel transport system substrate-binding protein
MRRSKRTLGAIALLSVFSIIAAACGGDDGDGGGGGGGGGQVQKGGVYRSEIEDFGFTGAFDPTGEYLGTAFGLFSQMMLRNLVTYKHVLGGEGDELVPDLATDTGTLSEDGLQYTFTLKDGVMWGPPLNRPITSADVKFAFQRIESSALVAQYGFYYDGVIEGMDGPVDEKAPDIDISGIETPDEKTVIFNLQQPTGDFLYRLAMPAAAPMPEEVAGCFEKAGDYGRNVVSSGPYMFLGSDQVDASSCDTIEPAAGFEPTTFMKMVRNPSYDAATDSPEVRSNNIDGVVITINTNTDDIFNKVRTGDIDGTIASAPPSQVLQQYVTDPALKDRFHADPGDRTWYITMNLLTPPFDDINVRKAVNFVIDKDALRTAWGGPTRGEIATHLIPPEVLDFAGEEYDPYPSANFAGDVNAAKEAMAQSEYDSDGDGVCDSDVCKNVLFVNRTSTPHVDMTPTIQQNLAQLGIDLKVRELDTGTAYTTIQTVNNLVPIAANAGWGKDYADASTFGVLWLSSGVSCEGQINYAEVGMTEDSARECGVLEAWQATRPDQLSVDADFEECNALLDEERRACWVEFDKKVMEEVVPWVPYLWATAFTIVGDSVTKYEYDQFAGMISLCHIAVNNNATVS